VIAVRGRRNGDHDLKRNVLVLCPGDGNGLGAPIPYEVASLHTVVGPNLDDARDSPNLDGGRLRQGSDANHHKGDNEDWFHLEPQMPVGQTN
jgi:hypothetical protein